MKLQEHQLQVINLLEENELALNQLYEAYAEEFHEYSWLWGRLAEEEKKHARWVSSLLHKIQDGSLFFNNSRFKAQAIQSFVTFLYAETEKVQNRHISLTQALSTALYIERSLIENRFLEPFEGDSPVLERVLVNLTKSTKAHQRFIEKAYEQYKKFQDNLEK